MARSSRAVAIGYPHHVTQRGNNREVVFFDDQDRSFYLENLKKYTEKYQIDIWAYCLMPNHIHLLAVPHTVNGLALGVGLTNQVYTRYVNRKYFRSGRVWQNRFYSCIVESDNYLWSVVRYIENNPVKAALVNDALDYRWSSAGYHLGYLKDDLLAKSSWLPDEDREDYKVFLQESDEQATNMINQATRSGRPLCTAEMLKHLERMLDRKF